MGTKSPKHTCFRLREKDVLLLRIAHSIFLSYLGIWRKHLMLYPYLRNSTEMRTHADFVATATRAEQTGKTIQGVKGLSPLLKLIEFPRQVVLDYMHLVCLGHMSLLIRRWLPTLKADDIAHIDFALSSLQLPHNMAVVYNFPIRSSSDWKAKHFRLFVLHVGFPIVLPFLTKLQLSHFALYTLGIRLLHSPESPDDVELADRVIQDYCRAASTVYDESIELFSLHAHLHLASQVRLHGGLAFTSAFCFESCIRSIKKRVHGTRDLAAQIAYWCDVEALLPRPTVSIESDGCFDKIDLSSPRLDSYRHELIENIHRLGENECDSLFFLRYKRPFITFHSLIYDCLFKCASYLVSYDSIGGSTLFGDVIIFAKLESRFYALIQRYDFADVNVSAFVDIPDVYRMKLNQMFPLVRLSNQYVMIPVVSLLRKCVRVHLPGHMCLSEVNVDFEHD